MWSVATGYCKQGVRHGVNGLCVSTVNETRILQQRSTMVRQKPRPNILFLETTSSRLLLFVLLATTLSVQ